jgi:hypothetical protein
MADSVHTPAEEWRAIPGFEDYESSSLGRIRSIDRVKPVPGRWGGAPLRRLKGKVLKPKLHTGGYLNVYTTGRVYLFVHRAVAMAFHGLPPTRKHEAAHLNGNRQDNRPENIVWATPIENAAHKAIHGTNVAGERNALSKLMAGQVLEIIRRYACGEAARVLASEFNVSTGLVTGLASGRFWKHLESEHREAAKVRCQHNIATARAAANRKRADAAISKRLGGVNGERLFSQD